MAKTRPLDTSAPLNRHPDRDLEYGFYYYADLLRMGIVRNRTDLHRKIKYDGFPRPEKSSDKMQAAAPFRKSKVHAYVDRRAARANSGEMMERD
ncbi:hypothetical protein QN224_06825 [Sinorhizobium sp. 8-89]|uniref:hypothetical protein n=1 Tax=Sinorhizobium sp. 7-81 TaxID=3049087 RepID=UPI0024C2D316|nr:hypothetical protein [Sinorhizobium sp. 7-81]MDK1385119.1 hypothetical protein [Sinorhizobium sp. 7-81]